MSTLQDEIRAGYRRGWSFTPVKGKRPVLTGWNTRPRASLSECLAWARRGNVGLRTGRASGIIVVDIDAPGVADDLDLPETVTAITGRGEHLYFRMPDGIEVRNSSNRLAPGVDVRGEGGQVVFVGSVHENGTTYEWARGLSPDDVEIADLPEWVVEMLVATAVTAVA